MASGWISYNELAWTEEWLADPAEYEEEVKFYVGLIKGAAAEPPRTLLHLGSGAGGQDTIFKRYFTVTGVDLSLGMLNLARARHPEIEYLEGDMRTLRLGRQFDGKRQTVHTLQGLNSRQFITVLQKTSRLKNAGNRIY
jgi:SAM-dependent methyltransferase